MRVNCTKRVRFTRSVKVVYIRKIIMIVLLWEHNDDNSDTVGSALQR